MENKNSEITAKKVFLPFYRFLAIGFLVTIVLQLLKFAHLITFSEDVSTGIIMYLVFYIGFICAIALLDEKRLKLL
ncbi:hypothetical protein [Chryseobacterium sp. CT-SW4]|uniref:hypothetical protein n=1 Tax=Chryseobacterium sp. SW-1 TaxID=3157343 RepID=UPI003B017D1A